MEKRKFICIKEYHIPPFGKEKIKIDEIFREMCFESHWIGAAPLIKIDKSYTINIPEEKFKEHFKEIK